MGSKEKTAYATAFFNPWQCMWHYSKSSMRVTQAILERRTRAYVAVAYVGLLATLGCGSGHSDMAPVTGTVTIDGNPVETGDIRFIPSNGRSAMGEIVDGKYTLRTYRENDGALLGSHRVSITAMKTKRRKGLLPEPPADAPPEEHQAWRDQMESVGFDDFEWLVPERYSYHDRSGLTAEVKPGTNEIDFPLTSKVSR